MPEEWVTTAVDYGDGPGDIGHRYTCTEGPTGRICHETCVALHATDLERAACAYHVPTCHSNDKETA